jgi:uncharacterized protein YqeY
MTLQEKITSDLKVAMLARDNDKRDTLRMLDSAIKNFQIEKKKRETGLNDEEIIEIVSRSVKQRQDSIIQFEKGGRPELAEKEKIELEILKVYLPEQLGQEEVLKIVQEVILQSGASLPSDMGKVMGLVMAKVKGKTDGNVVKKLVLEKLG